MQIINNADMRNYTSYKAGGCADTLIVVENKEELAETLKKIKAENADYIIIGNGSNTLITDKGYRGTVIKLGEAFDTVEVQGEKLICGAGALMSKAAKKALENSLTGFEFASGIPGSIGGGVFMNAGAYGGELKDIVEFVEIVKNDGSGVLTIKGSDMDFGYRHSVLEETKDVVTKVVFDLSKGVQDEIAATMADLTKRRNEKQPVQYPSCGSFFKRPEGYFAGKLIQDSGLRGEQVGGAQVSELHCGFIINKGGATATDILELMKKVQDTVYENYQVKLEPEVRIIGEL